MTKYYREIVICDSCKGEGTKYQSTLTDYHRGEYDVTPYDCPICDGKGRVKQITEVRIEKL